MEHLPFIAYFPIKASVSRWFPESRFSRVKKCQICWFDWWLNMCFNPTGPNHHEFVQHDSISAWISATMVHPVVTIGYPMFTWFNIIWISLNVLSFGIFPLGTISRAQSRHQRQSWSVWRLNWARSRMKKKPPETGRSSLFFFPYKDGHESIKRDLSYMYISIYIYAYNTIPLCYPW